MKFQSPSAPPPHQDRFLQRRMLTFVGLIALGLFVWQTVRISLRPEPPAQKKLSPDDVDFSVQADDRSAPLKDDEFRVAPRRSRPVRDHADDESENLNLHPSWLAEVGDNSVGIRKSEADAYYRILARVASIPAEKLAAAAVPDALFVNLMTSPDQYRGKPITITGEIGRLYEFRAPPNDHGVNRLYEAWIITSDSGWEHPYRVVCSAIPPEIKPDDGKHPSVRVTGYFFKREGYETAGGKLHVAPTLLAGRIILYQPPYSGPPAEDVVPWMIGVISVVGLAMLATVLGFALGDARGKRAKALSAAEVTTVDAAALSRADQRISIEESLRRLEDDTLFDEDPAHELNGHADSEESDDQTVDLPTPLPPTRPPQT